MHVYSCTIIKEVTQVSWPWRHAWSRTIFGPPLCHLVALQVGLRAHNKIFFKLFEILVFITCLKDTQIFFWHSNSTSTNEAQEMESYPQNWYCPAPMGLGRMGGSMKTTPCGPAPPSSEKPAMAYTSSENWQKYDIIVLLCKQDCTPSRHYISFVFGLSQHSLLDLHLIKISINFLCLILLVWG